MKRYIIYLILFNCVLLIQSCYTNLSIEDIDQELANLEKTRLELHRIKTEKESIKEEDDLFAGKGSKLKLKFEYYSVLGDKLYLAVERGYNDCIQAIFNHHKYNYCDFKFLLVGYAIYKSVETDKLNDIYGNLERIIAVKEELHACVAKSWLEAINQNDEVALAALFEKFRTDLDAIEIFKKFLEYSNSAQGIYFAEKCNLHSIPIEVLLKIKKILNSQFPSPHSALERKIEECILAHQFSYAVPIPVKKLSYKFRKPEVKLGEYSDSEDEDAPHFNGVYNLTKTGVYDIENTEEYYSPLRHEDILVDNYAKSYEDISYWKLNEDACEISRDGKNEILTVLCVALRQYDGRIKKFVFTNLDSGFHIATLKAIVPKAHTKGYHVIMAQRSHAEGELMQFLQERHNRYTHIVSIGCNNGHCIRCAGAMRKWLGQETLAKISIKEVYPPENPTWLIPKALENFLQTHECLPDLHGDTIRVQRDWVGASTSEGYQKHQKLTKEEWENRPWKRERTKQPETEEEVKGEEEPDEKGKEKRKERPTNVQEGEEQDKDISTGNLLDMGESDESSAKRRRFESETFQNEEFEAAIAVHLSETKESSGSNQEIND
jgi:hypothetical protein